MIVKKVYKRKTFDHGLDTRGKEYQRIWYLAKKYKISFEECFKNKEKYDINHRIKKHPEYNLYSSEYYKTIWLKKKYGITLKEYNELLESQNYVCSICGKKENHIHNKTKKKTDLAVDHCHDTGKIRGLLCTNCNIGIGYFKNNSDLLIAAAEYLKNAVISFDIDLG
jgi:hypothetical protein